MIQLPSYDIEVDESPENPEWDRFVITSNDPHPEQMSLWAGPQKAKGWQAFRILVRKDGAIIAGAQVLEKTIRKIARVAYVNRGPLATAEHASGAIELVHAIQSAAKKRGHTYLSVVLPYSSSNWIPLLERSGFGVSPDLLPPQTSMRATLVLDLSPSLEEILARMRNTTRRYIRQSLERGATVRLGGAEDLGTFEKLLATLCERRGVSPNVPTGKFLRDIWDSFAPKGYLKLFMVEYQGAPLSAVLMFTLGGWARVWRAGASAQHLDRRPNDLMYWSTIKWAKENGYRHWDFVGFDSENARALVAGEEIPEAQWCRMSFYKLGFGGRVLPLAPHYSYFPNPVVHRLFGAFGRPMLQSAVVRRLAGNRTRGAAAAHEAN